MKNLTHRRDFVTAGACALATPYFFIPTIVKAANPLTDGLVKSVRVTTDNLGMVPAGPQTGTDVAVAGGGPVFWRSIRGQAGLIAGGKGGRVLPNRKNRPVHTQT